MSTTYKLRFAALAPAMTNGTKRALLLECLSTKKTAIIVDPNLCHLPQQFKHGDIARLRLMLSWRFIGARMEIDELRIAAYLSFGGKSFLCRIPWDAVLEIEDEPAPPADKPRPNHLRLVKD